MVSKSRPYIEINRHMDLVEIEEAFSNGIDILCFGLEESLLNLLKGQIHPEDRQACMELMHVVKKLKDVIDEGYQASLSESVSVALW